MIDTIADKIARDYEASELCRLAVQLRDEDFVSKEALSLALPKWRTLVDVLKDGVEDGANYLYRKFVVPHVDEIYEQEIEEDVDEWCDDNDMVPCDPPKSVIVETGRRVKKELSKKLSYSYFQHILKDVLSNINPINVIKAAAKAIRKHGLRVGLKVALIIILGDIVIPTVAGAIHPALFAIAHASPHTEIGLAAVAISEGINKERLLKWVNVYEKETGEDLVKEKFIDLR